MVIAFVSFLAEKKVKKSDCGEWQWSVCGPTSGDCGLGTREGTRTGAECKQTMKTQRCKIPCNWKKQFGGQSHPVLLSLQSTSMKVFWNISIKFTFKAS